MLLLIVCGGYLLCGSKQDSTEVIRVNIRSVRPITARSHGRKAPI